jgi:serine protease inhibitor
VPLQDPDFHFRLLLPAETGVDGISKLARELPRLVEGLESGPVVDVRLELPTFDITSKFDSQKMAAWFGLTSALSRQADYSQIDHDVVIGSLAQACRVTVDPHGVRAEASTEAVGVPRSMDLTERQEIRFDRPFLFELVHHSGEIVFQGLFVGR